MPLTTTYTYIPLGYPILVMKSLKMFSPTKVFYTDKRTAFDLTSTTNIQYGSGLIDSGFVFNSLIDTSSTTC